MRTVVIFAPLAASITFTWQMGKHFPPARLGMNRWLWIGLVFVAANVLLFVFSKLTRRLMPLVALLKLTLVFPDNAPSRTKAALRGSNSRKMLRDMEAAKARGDVSGAAMYGDYIVQLLTEVNDHDRLTRGHSERVRAYSELLGEELGLSENDMNLLRWAALLHDVGKLTVPAEILNKDGKPTDDEWKLLQGHPAASRSLLEPLKPWLGDWVHAADQHHCRWDGNGYPDDLAGTDISVAGRLVAIADAFDVMTSARSYKKPLSAELARQELTACAGSQFDPMMVRAFLQIGLGRLQAVSGPLAWLANLTGSTQLPAPTVSIIGTSTWSAAVAVVGVVAVAVGGGQPEEPEVALELPMAAPSAIRVQDVNVDAFQNEPLTVTLTANGVEFAPSFIVGDPLEGVVSSPAVAVRSDADTWSTTVNYESSGDYVGLDGFTFEACDIDLTCADGRVFVDISPNSITPIPTTSTTVPETTTIPPTTVAPTTAPITVPPTSAPTTTTTPTTTAPTTTAPTTTTPTTAAPTTPTTAAPTTTTTTAPAAAPPARRTNQAPSAVDDSATIVEESRLLIDVVANDTDPDGDVLSLVSVGTPLHGQATIQSGRLHYTPDDDYVGPDEVTYTMTDGFNPAASGVFRVTVTPLNDPPRASNSTVPVAEDTAPGSALLQVVATDIDGDVLSFAITGGDPTGRFALTPTGALSLAADLDYEDDDTYLIEVTASDGLLSDSAIVTINVGDIDEAPIAGDDSTSTQEDIAIPFHVGTNDSDPEGLALTWAPLGTSAEGGTVTNIGSVFTYTPPRDFFGQDSYTYTASDPAGNVSEPATVTITVSPDNDAPTANDDGGTADYTTLEDNPTPLVTPDLTTNDTDPEDGSIVPGTAQRVDDATNGTAVHNGDGTFTYTPDPNFNGTDSFTYKVTDSEGAESPLATVTITVTPDNDVPTANGDALTVTQGEAGTTVDVRLNDDDIDGDPLSVTAVSVPTNGTALHNGDGTITYTHDGAKTLADSFTYTVTDPGGESATATVAVTITPRPDGDGISSGADNCPFHFNPLQIDTDGDGIGDVCDSTPTVGLSIDLSDSGQSLGTTEESFSVALGDLDGDGDLDAVFGNRLTGNTVELNDGSGDFINSGQVLGSADTDAVALGDIDGDGDLDAAFGNKGGSDTVWFNDGNGNFTDSGQNLDPNDTASIAFGDFDLDGDLDIATAVLDGNNRIWLNNGSGTFTDSGQNLGAQKGTGVAVGDLDDDGDLDLVFGHEDQINTVWLNNGGGVFIDSGQSLGNNKTHDLALGDLDDDGDIDIVFAEDADGDTVWFNDGAGNFTDTGQSLGSGHSHSVSLGDIGGDGDIDIILGDHVGVNKIYMNFFMGGYVDTGQTLGTAKTEAIVLGDVNGDGRLDAVTANDGEPNKVWLN